jgi:putative ABC transport system ATP-binding protein
LNEDDRAAVRAKRLGFVFQSFQLLANLNAIENVMLPLELLGKRDARATAQEMLQRVGLGERLTHYPKVLSGGEQQRVALARAFVVKPAVLLADEPTGSLDFATGERVMELMFDMNREAGTTLVLVTHDRAIAERCKRQIRIEAGKVVAERNAWTLRLSTCRAGSNTRCVSRSSRDARSPWRTRASWSSKRRSVMPTCRAASR